MDEKNEHPDYVIKQWAVDASILKNKKGINVKDVINDARKIYEFTNPSKCEVVILKNKRGKNKR